MLSQLFERIHLAERRLMRSFGTDISTPSGRRAAKWHFNLADHAFLRGVWTNLDEIAPGVWRSNQPSPRRIARHKRDGFKSILNLRGVDKYAHYLFEREACEAQGITLIDIETEARSLIPATRYLELFEIFDRIEKPFVMHCKSGADRAGLAAALWMIDQEGHSVAQARDMLSFRYLHRKRARTGLMDHVLDAFEADTAETGIPIRDWFRTRYDPRALTESFYAKMGWPLPEPE